MLKWTDEEGSALLNTEACLYVCSCVRGSADSRSACEGEEGKGAW